MSDFNPDEYLASADTPAPAPQTSAEGFDPDAFLEDARSEQYGTPGQMAKTFVEGAAEGLAGPLAPYLEKKLHIAKPEDMLARREENPITHGVGQAAGLLSPVGEGALIAKAGEAAAGAAGLSKAAALLPEASLGFKVGSSAVTNAAEMAVLSGSDETSKMILNDPKTSAESAIANIGLAAALGGAGGAFFTGAVSPLWQATAGPKVEAALGGFRNHINGGLVLPEELKAAESMLGIQVAPELKAAMSGNSMAEGHYNILKESQNKYIADGLDKLHTDLSESVGKGLGISPDSIAIHSENEAGHELLETFNKEYNQKYGPIAEQLEKRNAEAAKISISDDARLDRYGKLLEEGMNKVGTDSPAYKLYNEWGNRLLAKESVGGMDMLKTELGGDIEKAMRAGDRNTLQALRDIRSSIGDFQEQVISNQASKLEADGVNGAGKMASEMMAERAATNAAYKDFAKMSSELTDHLGVGGFKGAGTLKNKLSEKVSAEQLLNKFSFKGNADFIPFLQKNFPEVYEQVRQNELKRFLKPAVLMAKGEQPINISKLNQLIEKGMAGQKEYVQSILPQGAIERIQAADKLASALPNLKSSGTAGHLTKLLKDIPRSAMAAVAMVTGHNPFMGGIIGEMAQLLGRDAPDALRLAHLKFLGSSEPIKSEGFKAMVDFFHNTYKGENVLAKATENVFKKGTQVLMASQMPNEADRTKLDKAVTKMTVNPGLYTQSQDSHLGHYLPQHQQAVTQTTASQLQYLQQLKPKPHILGPLDKPVPPQPVEIARYNRALDIAQSPHIVLQHVKDGTLQISDIKDLHSMYPGLYQQMSTKLSNQMTSQHADEEPIPYKTKMGISLFLGTPVDASMQPQAMMASFLSHKQPQGTQNGEQPQQPHVKSMKSLGKSNASYQTPVQAAESYRGKRD